MGYNPILFFFVFCFWLKLFQFRPWGSSISWFLCPFDIPQYCGFYSLSMSLLFGTTKHHWIIIYVPCFSFRISCFSKDPWFQGLGVGCVHCYWSAIGSRLSLLIEKGNPCLCADPHLHTYLWIFVYPSVPILS